MSLAWAIPFLGLLLTIAVGQAGFPAWWERHHPAITALWCAATLVPLAATVGPAAAWRDTAEMLVLDYLPFVAAIYTLYAIAGGIHIRTRMSGHPGENAVTLALGTLAAGLMGGAGATLLFLPVLLKANAWRRHQVHTMVFVIFLVSNIGAGLTPLGPPLLLGLIKGVPFQWTVWHMLAPTALAAGLLIGLYLLLDAVALFPREDGAARAAHRREHDVITIEGAGNLVLLVAVMAAVMLSGAWDMAATLPLGPVAWPVKDLVRLLAMVLLAAVSLHRTAPRIRAANHFAWAPMAEVAVLFAGIFITLLPVQAILKAGPGGALGGLIRLVTATDGRPLDWAYFAVTGALSSLLDNAPTFLVLFDVAGGDPATLSGPGSATLLAISAGAAMWGGATYIGNAPNFMVRAMAERRGIRMPGFLGFLLWSGTLLLPALAVVAVVFFAAPGWLLAGLALPAAGLAWRARRHD